MGLLSSGFLLKMLLGAVAVAAVGGVTASAILDDQPPAVVAEVAPEAPPAADDADSISTLPSTTTGIIVAVAEEANGETTRLAAVGEGVATVAAANEYAMATQAWSECVAAVAVAHTGGPFDPFAECGDRPIAGDFGLGPDAPGHDPDGPGASEDAPGHDPDGPGVSEDAPGQSEDGPGASEDAPGQNKDPKDPKEPEDPEDSEDPEALGETDG